MFDLNKLATDLITFSTVEFNYISINQKYCTGSSIMPQKKNCDVLEIMRANYSVLLGEEIKVKSLIANLISGYHRDLQLTKEPVIKAFKITSSSLEIISDILKTMTVNKKNCQKAMTKELYATEEAYMMVKDGVPFREAYKEIGKKYI